MAWLACECEARLGARFRSFLLYGSLATGDFVPGYSDMDHVLVVREPLDPAATEELDEVFLKRFPDLPATFHGLEPIPEARLSRLDLDDEECLLPRDLGSLKLHGQVLAGADLRPVIRMPTFVEMREALVYLVIWAPDPDFETRCLKTLRTVLNSVFLVAGSLLFAETGVMTYSKAELEERYPRIGSLPEPDLVLAAAAARRAWTPEADVAPSPLADRYIEYHTAALSWIRERGLHRFRALRTAQPGIEWVGP